MQRWIVQDKNGLEVYLTEERWQHILLRHPPLSNHLKDILNTIRFGRRKKDRLQPFKYFYHRRCDTLPGLFTHITVVVLNQPENNRYVVTTWSETEI